MAQNIITLGETAVDTSTAGWVRLDEVQFSDVIALGDAEVVVDFGGGDFVTYREVCFSDKHTYRAHPAKGVYRFGRAV